VTTPARVSVQERIRRFIEDEVLEEPFSGEDPLEEDMLDSVAIEQLVDFLEYEYGIEFVDEEVTSANFSTLAVLAALVEQKRAAAASP
jgi:acyl carrier protein